MTEGRAILIDDFTLADPRALSAIYPALDGRGQVSIDAHEGEVIKAEPGYFVVACHNPSAPGARLSPWPAVQAPLRVLPTTTWPRPWGSSPSL